MSVKTANSTKELGISSNDAKKIAKLYNGDKKNKGVGARTISEQTGFSRRKVMRTLELAGVTSFSETSYN